MPIQKTTRKEIIANSIRVFRRKGYYRTSMKDLADEVGMSKGVFYHHFDNKREVMQLSLQALADWFNRKIFSIAYDSTLPSKDRLIQMAEIGYQAFTIEEGGCFFANTILETAHVEDTFLKEVDHFFVQWEKAFTQIFQDSFQGEELLQLTQQVIADIEGSIILMQLRKDPSYLKRAFDRTISRI